MLTWARLRFATPQISQRLLRHLDEDLVENMPHHWVVYIRPGLVAALGVVFLALTFSVVAAAGWFCIGVGCVLLLWAGYRALSEHMDRFVLTNRRVFRVRGVFDQSAATMPLKRVLDITVQKPLLGRILGYGHFTFESAAQEQGLREIRFLPGPDRLEMVIQEQVQRAGLLGKADSWQD